MHDGMPYGRNQAQGQGHSREVDRQSPTGLIFSLCVGLLYYWAALSALLCLAVPSKSSACQLYEHLIVHLGNKLIDWLLG